MAPINLPAPAAQVPAHPAGTSVAISHFMSGLQSPLIFWVIAFTLTSLILVVLIALTVVLMKRSNFKVSSEMLKSLMIVKKTSKKNVSLLPTSLDPHTPRSTFIPMPKVTIPKPARALGRAIRDRVQDRVWNIQDDMFRGYEDRRWGKGYNMRETHLDLYAEKLELGKPILPSNPWWVRKFLHRETVPELWMDRKLFRGRQIPTVEYTYPPLDLEPAPEDAITQEELKELSELPWGTYDPSSVEDKKDTKKSEEDQVLLKVPKTEEIDPLEKPYEPLGAKEYVKLYLPVEVKILVPETLDSCVVKQKSECDERSVWSDDSDDEDDAPALLPSAKHSTNTAPIRPPRPTQLLFEDDSDSDCSSYPTTPEVGFTRAVGEVSNYPGLITMASIENFLKDIKNPSVPVIKIIDDDTPSSDISSADVNSDSPALAYGVPPSPVLSCYPVIAFENRYSTVARFVDLYDSPPLGTPPLSPAPIPISLSPILPLGSYLQLPVPGSTRSRDSSTRGSNLGNSGTVFKLGAAPKGRAGRRKGLAQVKVNGDGVAKDVGMGREGLKKRQGSGLGFSGMALGGIQEMEESEEVVTTNFNTSKLVTEQAALSPDSCATYTGKPQALQSASSRLPSGVIPGPRGSRTGAIVPSRARSGSSCSQAPLAHISRPTLPSAPLTRFSFSKSGTSRSGLTTKPEAVEKKTSLRDQVTRSSSSLPHGGVLPLTRSASSRSRIALTKDSKPSPTFGTRSSSMPLGPRSIALTSNQSESDTSRPLPTSHLLKQRSRSGTVSIAQPRVPSQASSSPPSRQRTTPGSNLIKVSTSPLPQSPITTKPAGSLERKKAGPLKPPVPRYRPRNSAI